jgi:uncharacterized protein
MQVLNDSECLDLLSTVRLGRIALTHNALPIILPVTFACLDRDLIFSVSPGVLARAAADEQIVCFESDWLDDAQLNAWSVVVIGRLSMMTDPVHLRRAQRLELTPWSADPTVYVKLAPEIYSGRRGIEPPRCAAVAAGRDERSVSGAPT